MKEQDKYAISEQEREAINILKYGGYSVIIGKETFSIYLDGVKRYGFSSRHFLKSPEYMIKEVIKRDAFKNGYDKGQNNIKQAFHKLMEV